MNNLTFLNLAVTNSKIKNSVMTSMNVKQGGGGGLCIRRPEILEPFGVVVVSVSDYI